MVERTELKVGETVLDPACGTGGFLTAAIDHLRALAKTPVEQQLVQGSIHGVEKKPLPHLLCTTNLMLHGIEVPLQVRHANTLAHPLRDRGESEQVDVILTNPPFGGVEEDGVEKNFPPDYQTRETADLFLVLILHLLKAGGRAAVVLPDGTLFGEGIKTKIKKRLLTECDLHTIVRMPKGVFAPYTSIQTNLLFFTKGARTEHVWFYEHPYPDGQKSYSKTRPLTLDEFGPERAWWNHREVTPHAWKVSIQEIEARNWSLDWKNPHAAAAATDDPDALLAAYDAAARDVATVRDALRDALAKALAGA
jgi:type I restriction enzyme M protein